MLFPVTNEELSVLVVLSCASMTRTRVFDASPLASSLLESLLAESHGFQAFLPVLPPAGELFSLSPQELVNYPGGFVLECVACSLQV